MIEFEHLVEICECIFDEPVVAIPTLSDKKLCGRRNMKKIASDIYTIGYSLISGLEDSKLKQILKKDRTKLNDSLSTTQVIDTDDGEKESLILVCAELKTTVNVLTTLVKQL